MKIVLPILAILILSGCVDVKSDYYCGCPEYKLKGIIKDTSVNVHKGLFYETVDCHVSLDDGNNLFVEGGVCREMESGLELYKSRNRNTFYAVCDPDMKYIQRDKCEYEINDISDATVDALGINNTK